ncbi:MAG: peptidase inhibitor family I36 protein [Solirubrobacterales bacterium]
MRRIALVALATLSLAGGTAYAVEGPNPVQPLSSCDDGHACVWKQSNYGGEQLSFGRNFNNNNWSGIAMVGGANSAKNRLGPGFGFGIADGPPGNRNWSDCIGNDSERPTPNGTITYVQVKDAGC